VSSALLVSVGNLDQDAFGPGSTEKFDTDGHADPGSRRCRREPGWHDDGRKPGHRPETAIAFYLRLANRHNQSLLMRKNNGIKALIRHYSQDPLLQFSAFLQTNAIAVVELEALGLLDVIPDIRMEFSGGPISLPCARKLRSSAAASSKAFGLSVMTTFSFGPAWS
jgi:hypothetical protein